MQTAPGQGTTFLTTMDKPNSHEVQQQEDTIKGMPSNVTHFSLENTAHHNLAIPLLFLLSSSSTYIHKMLSPCRPPMPVPLLHSVLVMDKNAMNGLLSMDLLTWPLMDSHVACFSGWP